MKLKILNPRKSRAQAMVEFAIALPVLLALLYGILEAGRLMFMYSTVVNASRQAVRWGSTTGIGTDGTEPRYQDCDGIRAEAQKAGYIGAFNTVTLKYDSGPGTSETTYCSAGATTDNTFIPNTNNTSRISVTVEKQFDPIVPNLVPFISRNIRATSSRTILVSIDIVVTPPVPPKAATTTLITSDLPDPSNVGQTVPVTVTVSGGSTTPTGTVNITGADVNCTITLSGGTGTCNVVFNSGGNKLLNASYVGDSTHLASTDPDGETHKVKYPVVIAITSHNPDPSTTGQAVNVVVSVTSPLPIPNGQTISITGANTNCTITLPATNCNVVFTSTGEKTITATYVGDADHSGGTATAIHDVLINKVTVTRITSDTPDPSELNQSVTVSVRVVGLTLPTGTVNITGADTNCSITLSNGTGSCTVIFTSVGGRSLVAAYTGNANSDPSTSASAAHTVGLKTTTTTIVSHNPDPSSMGQPVTVTVTVAPAVIGGSTPTGTISITGADTPCTITLPATSCNVVFNGYGTKTLSAQYNGDATHAPSNTTATHIVSAPSETPVPSCNSITHGPITLSGNTMTMTITNPYLFPLRTGAGTVTWHYDKGHQTGSDKTLELLSITIGTTSVWTGNSSNVSTIPFTTPAIIPPTTTVTITFTFHQSYDNYKGTENIYINLTTPGCEGNPIQS